MQNVLGYPDIVTLIIATKDLAMEQISKKRVFTLRMGCLAAILYSFLLSTVLTAHSFVLCPQIHQLPGGRSILVRYYGSEFAVTNGSPLLLPQMGKNPCSIIFGTKFIQKLSDDKTVRCTSRKPGRTDYLWYDIELVLENQETEEMLNREPHQYHWIIKKRDLDQVPLRIPEAAIIIYLPAAFIAELTSEQVPVSAGTFYLPIFALKKNITREQLENYLDESDMRQLKDKRFFSNTTMVGTVPTAVQLLNS